MPKSIRMAIFLDKGANARPQIIDTFASDRSISVVVVNGEDIRTGCLKNADVLFIPGGSGKKEAFSLGEDGQEKIRQFTHDGGIYVGVCAGCYLASSSRPEYLGLMPLSNVDKQHWRRGKAFIPIKFTKLGMEIFGLKQENADVLYHNGPIFPHDYEHKNEIAPLSYFLGEIVGPEGQVGLMVNSPAMVLTRYGNGLVLGISPHPEATPGLEAIELHAVHWLYNNRNHVKMAAPVSYAPISSPASASSPTPASSVLTEQTATTLPERIYNKAEEIFEHTRICHYRHLQEGVEDQVRKVNGTYEANTDCSGFVSYVINSVSPGHYDVVYQMSGRTYPHARTFVILIGQLRTDIPTNGWLRLGSFRNLRRGDLIAWEKHKEYARHEGGCVRPSNGVIEGRNPR